MSQVNSFSEDFGSIYVGDGLEFCFHELAYSLDVLGYSWNAIVVAEAHELSVNEGIVYVLVSQQSHDVQNVFGFAYADLTWFLKTPQLAHAQIELTVSFWLLA